jgi:hypothetical protein
MSGPSTLDMEVIPIRWPFPTGQQRFFGLEELNPVNIKIINIQ